MNMDKWNLLTILVALCGMAATLVLTPVFRVIARKTDFMDRPANNHKGHRQATPLLGGAAMFTAWIICLTGGMTAIFGGMMPEYFQVELLAHIEGFHFAVRELAFIVAGATTAVVLGLIDDRWELKASVKFAGQFVVALLAVVGGGVRFNIFPMPEYVSVILSLFWMMLLMNSINFFDNMDGLAVGTIAIAMGFFTVIALFSGQWFFAAFAALNFGVCCGFWFYNANPATVFMGDSGSHFLGYLAAVVSSGVTFFDVGYSLSRFPVLIPVLILALPLFDTAMVVVIRTCKGKPFWIGDHNHISHRFVRLGLSRRGAVALVHLMALSIALATLPIYWGNFYTAAVLVLQVFLLLTIVTVMQLAAKDDSERVK